MSTVGTVNVTSDVGTVMMVIVGNVIVGTVMVSELDDDACVVGDVVDELEDVVDTTDDELVEPDDELGWLEDELGADVVCA